MCQTIQWGTVFLRRRLGVQATPSALQNGRLGVQAVAHCHASPLRLKNYGEEFI